MSQESGPKPTEACSTLGLPSVSEMAKVDVAGVLDALLSMRGMDNYARPLNLDELKSIRPDELATLRSWVGNEKVFKQVMTSSRPVGMTAVVARVVYGEGQAANNLQTILQGAVRQSYFATYGSRRFEQAELIEHETRLPFLAGDDSVIAKVVQALRITPTDAASLVPPPPESAPAVPPAEPVPAPEPREQTRPLTDKEINSIQFPVY